MSTTLRVELFAGSLATQLTRPHPEPAFYWLGQAGFAVVWRERRWLIDPYLSDHLARKYAGQEFSHARMTPAPVRAEELPRVDLVLCTHRHGDHLDPETLAVIAARHPRCRLVVPAAELDYARSLGLLPAVRLVGAEAEQRLTSLGPGAPDILPLPAAHEELRRNAAGRHHFLGYVLTLVDGGVRLFHSGDCVPYPGLAERLLELRCDVALLPVNGRPESLRGRGIAGNFMLAEAVALCRQAGIPTLVAHHYGMFAFNTIAPTDIDEAALATDPKLRLVRAQCGRRYVLSVN